MKAFLGPSLGIVRFFAIGPVRGEKNPKGLLLLFRIDLSQTGTGGRRQGQHWRRDPHRSEVFASCASEACSRTGMKDLTFSPQSRLSYWFPAILVAILISILSTDYFAAEHTSRIIIPALHWLFPWAPSQWLHLLHFGIRKMAHVGEFGVFSVLVYRGVRAGQTGWRLSWAFTTLVIAASYAGLDEWHQSFVRLRQSSPRDAAIDIFGAILAQAIVWWYAKQE